MRGSWGLWHKFLLQRIYTFFTCGYYKTGYSNHMTLTFIQKQVLLFGSLGLFLFFNYLASTVGRLAG